MNVENCWKVSENDGNLPPTFTTSLEGFLSAVNNALVIVNVGKRPSF